MGGIEMMLKSMGIDPDEIRKSVSEFGQVVLALKEQMDRVEKKLDFIIGDVSASENETEKTEIEHINGVN